MQGGSSAQKGHHIYITEDLRLWPGWADSQRGKCSEEGTKENPSPLIPQFSPPPK